MSQHQPCPYCGNLDFEEENGILVCTSCGRQQEGGPQVADDDADFGTQGKVVRKKVEKTKVKATKTYRGPQAYRLYLQAWQHILWKQCHALVHGSHKAPAELWTVVKDLWTLKLSQLVKHSHDKREVVENDDDINPLATSAIDSEDETEHSDSGSVKRLSPKLWDTIALIYFAALLLRLPISLHELFLSLLSEEVPFIRAVRYVPHEITSRLPPEYQIALDTVTIPKPSAMQKRVDYLVRDYVQAFGMSLPALNWRIMLFKWIRALGLPLEVYAAVKQMAELVGYDFVYQLPQTQHTRESNNTAKMERRSPVAMPEIQLISLIVVSVKLLFPFDRDEQSTLSSSQSTSCSTAHLTSLSLDWSAWLQAHQDDMVDNKTSSNSIMPAEKAIEVQDMEILKMSPEAMDSYMDWYQRTFVLTDDRIKDKKSDSEMSILNIFPLGQNFSATKRQPALHQLKPSALISQVSSLATKSTLPRHNDQEEAPYVHDSLIAPGSQYPVYSTLESLKDYGPHGSSETKPPIYFHEKAAELACLDLKRLLKAVRHTERKLEKWIEDERRKEAFDEVENDRMDADADIDAVNG